MNPYLMEIFLRGPVMDDQDLPEEPELCHPEDTYGWICPMCFRVWSPKTEECWKCNDCLENNETTGNN
jgi:hypothetical protein